MALPLFIRDKPSRTVTGGGIGLGMIGLLCIVFVMGQPTTNDVADGIDDLRGELTSQQESLASDLVTLNRDISSVDVERVNRDSEQGHELMLALTGTSGSQLGVGAAQKSLSTRFDAFDEKSQALTEFLPEWISATASDGPAVYQLGSMDTRLTRVAGLDYSYTATARLDPVSADGEDGEKDERPSEIVLLRFSTTSDGALKGVEAWRISSDSRNALLENTDASGDDENEPTPTTTGSDDS